MDKMLSALRHGYQRYLLLRRWRDIVEAVSEIICSKLGDAEIYVFGSVVSNDYTAASDIDVLVVSGKASEDKHYVIDLQLYLEDALGLPPGLLHLHVVNPGSERYHWFMDALRIRKILIKACRREEDAAYGEG